MDKIQEWLKETPYKDYAISIASADASFRKYYRLSKEENRFLVMDSSLEKTSLSPFIEITSRLLKYNVNVPAILEKNLEDGYLIIEDFGNRHYLDLLNKDNFKELYTKAIDEILSMQKADTSNLPLYDKEFLHFEMDLMEEWYLTKKLHKKLNVEQKTLLDETLNVISDIVLSQPQNVFVHRDYHSRNIMLTSEQKIGIIDYQDAMSGALTYDLVSLLKDCYIEFERKEIEKLVLYFKNKTSPNTDDKTFIKWFDFMGLQRHIKVLGIFSRLHLRDGKDGYLKDIPLTLKYTLETASRYEETKRFSQMLKELTL